MSVDGGQNAAAGSVQTDVLRREVAARARHELLSIDTALSAQNPRNSCRQVHHRFQDQILLARWEGQVPRQVRKGWTQTTYELVTRAHSLPKPNVGDVDLELQPELRS